MPLQQPMQPMPQQYQPFSPMQGLQQPGQAGIAPDYGAMLGVYGDQLELTELERQLAIAEALRDTAMPEGRTAGKLYQAPNPLEFIGAGLKQYAGYKRSRDLQDQMDEIRQRIGEQVRQYGQSAPSY